MQVTQGQNDCSRIDLNLGYGGEGNACKKSLRVEMNLEIHDKHKGGNCL